MEMTKRKWLITSLTAVVWSLSNLAHAASGTIADLVAANPDLSTLSKLVAQAGLTESLRATGPYTLFAPTNDAFKALPQATLDKLADPEALKTVLLFHVLPSAMASDVVTTSSVKTLAGPNLALSKAGTFVTVEDAVATQADIKAANGVIHVIDRVLIPPIKK